MKELGDAVLERDEGENVATYAFGLTEANGDYGNFAVKLNTKDEDGNDIKFEITQLPVTITANERSKVYGADDPELTYKITIDKKYKSNKEEELKGILEKIEGGILTREKGEDVKDTPYKITANVEWDKEGSLKNYKVSFTEGNFKITQLPVEVSPEAGQSKVYGADEPKSYSYTVTIPTETAGESTKGSTEVMKELGDAVLKRDKGEDVAAYAFGLTKANGDYGNFAVKLNTKDEDGNDIKFEITQLPVVVSPVENQSKVYMADDPDYDYSVNIPEETKGGSNKTAADVKKELQDKSKPVLERESGEDVIEGGYVYSLTNEYGNYGNFKVTFSNEKNTTFKINKLPVTVYPNEGQRKTYGENDKKPYGYTIDYDTKSTNFKEENILDELTDNVLVRAEGELPGNYEYSIRSGEDLFKNYDLKVGGEETFTIYPVEIGDIQSIDSRQGSFDVKTNIDDSNRKEDVVTRVKVEAKFPDSKEISFSEDIETYIKSANEGIGFSTSETTVKIQDAVYAKTRKDNKKALEWTGKLPAGTEVTVSVVDAKGNPVSKESKVFKVAKKTVTLYGWSGTKAGTTGNYTVANGGKSERLTLTGDHENEYVEILYSQTKGGAAEASYAKMKTTFIPVVNNSGSTHVMQHITAGIVDTLNLTCTSVDHTFYVDDQAFPIESSAIQFENRGKEIKIRLPETGTITNVSIAGAKVETSGSQGQDFTFKVDWSGKNLIPTGTAISVTYKDQAGHEGTGTGTATRSSVSTPITFRIRPELNANGYLNGQSNTLIVSGAACSCEPIRVTAAGQSQTVNATQVDTWSDSNGSWEVMFDMNSFPEKQDFTISAEYTDVNGASHSISAKYEAFVSPANIASPIYEAMTHISGMVEPGTAVALVINGDKKKYQEIEVDRFGRLSMDDVPMMFGGEDSFDIYVQDIAGNVSISHYEIPEAKDPSEVTSSVNPLGKYIFQGDKEKASSYAATPISGKDFTDKKDTLELPLIMGMSYEVGKLTVKKSSNGIVVSSAIDANGIDKEDYKIENEHLYVYKAKPSADDIEKKTGKEYAYGEEIPLGENDTIWIVDNKDMTILTESIEELELFNYKESKEYETYQEQ